MKVFSSLSLTKKILGIEIAILLLILTPSSFLEYRNRKKSLLNESTAQIESIINDLAYNLQKPMWDYAQMETESLIENAAKSNVITQIILFDSEDHKVYSSKTKSNAATSFFNKREIFYKEKKIGRIEVFTNSSGIDFLLKQLVLELGIRNGLTLLLITLLTFVFIQKTILKRIFKLESEAKKLNLNILDSPFDWENDFDEIGSLGKNLNEARASLKNAFTKIEMSNADLIKLNNNLESLVAQKTAQIVHSSRMASLGEMSAGIAHEINNPLAIISGNLQLLNKVKDHEEIFNTKTGTMIKACDRISKIVKGLKKFSRSSDGMECKEESLADICNEVLIITEAKSKSNFTPIQIKIEDGLKILCDGVEIEQVLVNLINNGVDAVKDLPDKWLKLNAFLDKEKNEVVIQVIDSGTGISPEVESKLFQPFFTTKKVGEGTGLGLSITKGILEQHHAQIYINKTFKNTCFEIRFSKSQKAVIAA